MNFNRLLIRSNVAPDNVQPGSSAAFAPDSPLALGRWIICDHIAEHSGSPQRVFVGGHSAGGEIAAFMALRENWLAQGGLSTDVIKSCFCLATTFNRRSRWCQSAFLHRLGWTRRRATGAHGGRMIKVLRRPGQRDQGSHRPAAMAIIRSRVRRPFGRRSTINSGGSSTGRLYIAANARAETGITQTELLRERLAEGVAREMRGVPNNGNCRLDRCSENRRGRYHQVGGAEAPPAFVRTQ